MPLCTLHLIRLQHDDSGSKHARRAQFFIRLLSTCLAHRIIMASVVRRPVIVANRIDPVYLNSTGWDILLVIGPEKGNPQTSPDRQQDPPNSLSLQEHPQTKADVAAEYTLDVGIPSKVLLAYAERTEKLKANAANADTPSVESLLLNPARAHPGYTPKTSQLLEISDDLVELINELDGLKTEDMLADATGPVLQLNLLSFKKIQEDKDRYHKYGQVSCQSITFISVCFTDICFEQNFAGVATSYGGEAKLVGLVVESESKKELPRWDEVALASYHSIRHFAAMAASEEYQSINRDYRLPSLDDTTIICTQEVDLARLQSKSNARL